MAVAQLARARARAARTPTPCKSSNSSTTPRPPRSHRQPPAAPADTGSPQPDQPSAGVQINSDAIDNAAGVNCSDNEINIKILLDRVVRDGDLTTKQRDTLLASMTNTIADQVLADNDGQTRALYIAATQANAMSDVHIRYLKPSNAPRASTGHSNTCPPATNCGNGRSSGAD